jgi:GNAT superfamily N-acetyltransferase
VDIDDDFIQTRTVAISLRNDTAVVVRPIVSEDRERLQQGLETLSFKSRYLRFLRPKKRLTDQELAFLTDLDYVNHFAWGAIAPQLSGEPGIAVARYVRLPDQTETAEIAIVVIDDFQGLGLGTVLLWLLGETAIQYGVERFVGYLLPENHVMLGILNRFGAIQKRHDAMLELKLALPLPPAAMYDPGLVETLRRAAVGQSRR